MEGKNCNDNNLDAEFAKGAKSRRGEQATAKTLTQRARRVAQRAQRFRMAIRWSLFAAFGRYWVAAMAATILSMTARSAEVPGVWLSTRMEKMTCLPLAASR